MSRHLKFELKQYLGSHLSTMMVLGFLLFVFLGFYPSFKDQSEQMMIMLENFPPEMLSAMGIDPAQFMSFGGFLSYVFTYVVLILCIYTMNLGLSLSSKEKRTSSTDFLYVKPMSRTSIVLNKIVIGLFYTVIMNLVLGLIMMLLIKVFDITQIDGVFNLWLSGFYLSAFFLCLGLMIGSFNLKIKKTLGMSSGIVLGFFMLLMMGRMIDLDIVKNLTPFGHLDFSEVLRNGLTLMKQFGFVLVSVLMLLISIIVNTRKDLV